MCVTTDVTGTIKSFTSMMAAKPKMVMPGEYQDIGGID